MQILSRHIPVLGRLFLVIFIMATSGFSVAMTYCTMGCVDVCPMANATDDDQDMSGSCTDHASPQGAKQIALSNNDPCMRTTIAGGLQTDPMTSEKISLGQQLSGLIDLPAVLPVQISNLVLERQFTYYLSAGANVSPPSVEKYVLNATFLI